MPSTEQLASVSAVICETTLTAENLSKLGSLAVVHGLDASHLQQGDVVSLSPEGVIRTLFRRGSPHNTLFATERCNSFCVMCSQPPREVDDGWRVDEMLKTVELVDPDTVELGISGGEPTLLGEGLVSVINACKHRLPTTSLHILSNGRLFRYPSLAAKVAAVEHPNVMFGVPLYSHLDNEHDHVVQSRGAFKDTMLGLQNMGRVGIPVEIRVVIHKMTYQGLEALVDFIYRNLTFARHVALMGLEATGFAKGNMEALWVDPMDYGGELSRATLFLAQRGMTVSIYNHQLCVVPEMVWPYCRQSISDWKNEYAAVCQECSVKSECGGMFVFNLKGRTSRGLAPRVMPYPESAQETPR